MLNQTNETDRSPWKEQGYTDLFEQEGWLWGFPPNGVMPVPLAIVRRTSRFNFTEIPPRPTSSGFPSMPTRWFSATGVETTFRKTLYNANGSPVEYTTEDFEIFDPPPNFSVRMRGVAPGYEERRSIAHRIDESSQEVIEFVHCGSEVKPLSDEDLSQSIQTPSPESEQPEL